MFFQSAFVSSHQIHLIAQALAGDGHHLPALIGQKALQLGQLLQKLRFLQHVFAHLAEVLHGIGRVFVGTGQKQGIHLGLRSGDGDDLNNIFFVCVFLDGRTAAYTVVLAHGLPHGETVQQRGDQCRF